MAAPEEISIHVSRLEELQQQQQQQYQRNGTGPAAQLHKKKQLLKRRTTLDDFFSITKGDALEASLTTATSAIAANVSEIIKTNGNSNSNGSSNNGGDLKSKYCTTVFGSQIPDNNKKGTKNSKVIYPTYQTQLFLCLFTKSTQRAEDSGGKLRALCSKVQGVSWKLPKKVSYDKLIKASIPYHESGTNKGYLHREYNGWSEVHLRIVKKDVVSEEKDNKRISWRKSKVSFPFFLLSGSAVFLFWCVQLLFSGYSEIGKYRLN